MKKGEVVTAYKIAYNGESYLVRDENYCLSYKLNKETLPAGRSLGIFAFNSIERLKQFWNIEECLDDGNTTIFKGNGTLKKNRNIRCYPVLHLKEYYNSSIAPREKPPAGTILLNNFTPIEVLE